MTEISHLVVDGCSYTYCSNLKNIKEQGWPTLLAKKLGVPVVNIAENASGCDGIVRRTNEYFYKDKPFLNNPFYIIGWSGSLRREEFIKEDKGPVHIMLTRPYFFIEEFLAEQLIPEAYVYYELKKLIHWSSLMNLFKLHNVPYMMADFIPFLEPDRQKLEKNYNELYNYVVNDPNTLPNIRDYMKAHDGKYTMSCGHYDKTGNEILADFFYEQLIKRYTITPVQKNYYEIYKQTNIKSEWA